MPSIRLPDGSVRSFDAPVTVADVAKSIGAGLAKAALAGRVGEGADAKVVDTSYLLAQDTQLSIITDKDAAGPGPDPPLHRAPARLRGEGAVSRRAGDHRPGDRERLLLRLRLQAAVHARRSGGDREAHGGAGGEGRARRASRAAARRRRGVLQSPGRALQGRDHRQHPSDEDVSLYAEGEL